MYKEDYPWDIRVEKITKSLVQAGNKVYIVAKNQDQRPTFSAIDDLQIFRLPVLKGWPAFFRKMVNFPIWFNPFWLIKIFQVVRAYECKIIIVRDLPLMGAGILLSKILDTKIIFDMAECYPEMYRSAMENDAVGILSRIIKNPIAVGHYEKFCAKYSDHIFVMIDESKDRLIAKGIEPAKISIVSNTPILDVHNLPSIHHSGESLRIVYLGFLTRIRGIDLTMRAIREFIDAPNGGSNIRFDIIGKGSAKSELQVLLKTLRLENHVFIHGWLDFEDVKKIVSDANVGSLTYRYCSHWNNTIPNKLFDYMLAGLPVLTTNIRTISRIVNETNCGRYTDNHENISQLTQHLIALKDSDLRSQLGVHGQRAVLERYNWNIDSALMLKKVEDLYPKKSNK